MFIEDAPIVRPTPQEWAAGPFHLLTKLHSQYGQTDGVLKIIPPSDYKIPYKVWRTTEIKFRPKVQDITLINGIARQEKVFELRLRVRNYMKGTPLKRGSIKLEDVSVNLFQLHIYANERRMPAEDILRNRDAKDSIFGQRVHKMIPLGALVNLINQHVLKESINMKTECNSMNNSGLYQCKVRDPEIGFEFWKAINGDSILRGKIINKMKGKTTVKYPMNYEERYSTEDLLILVANGKTPEEALELNNSVLSGDSVVCELCLKYIKLSHRSSELVSCCSGCSGAVHKTCWAQGDIDSSFDWFCPKCSQSDEHLVGRFLKFGFDETPEAMTLRVFKSRCLQNLENSSIHEVETVFNDTVFDRAQQSGGKEVLYGSDLDALHVSEYPDISTVKSMNFQDNCWDLRFIPLMKHSLVAGINHRGEMISGISRPWIYAGSPLSTFCWHAEDHYMYSLNYLHEGKAKVWYSCPGRYLSDIEAVFKAEMPMLYESSKDLHHHLVTFLNPQMLIARGIPMKRVEQHAGELVVTFPKAYHAGFNSGYNLAEAVNVACDDWLPFAIESEKRYSNEDRQGVFSVDGLVWELSETIEERSCELALTVLDHLRYMSTYWNQLEEAFDMFTDAPEISRRSMGEIVGERRSSRLQRQASTSSGSALVDYPKCLVCKRFCFLLAMKAGKDVFYCHDHAIPVWIKKNNTKEIDEMSNTNDDNTVLYEHVTKTKVLEKIRNMEKYVEPYILWKREIKSVVRNLCSDTASSISLSSVSISKSGRTVRPPKKLVDSNGNVIGLGRHNGGENSVYTIISSLRDAAFEKFKVTESPEIALLRSEQDRIDKHRETLHVFLTSAANKEQQTDWTIEELENFWKIRFSLSDSEMNRALAGLIYQQVTLFHRNSYNSSKDRRVILLQEETAQCLSPGELKVIRKEVEKLVSYISSNSSDTKKIRITVD